MLPRWLFWTIVTLLTWGIWAILGKLIGDDLSAEHSQVLSTAGLLPVIVALYFSKEPTVTGNRRRGVLLALASGIASSLGNIFYYELLQSSKAATIIPLTALYPLVTTLLAVAVLRERLNSIQILGVALSFSAIYLFNVPDEKGWNFSRFAGAAAAIGLWGVTGLLQKMSTNHISARRSAIWFLWGFIPVGGWLLLRDPLPSGISPEVWGLATLLGFTLALGNFTILLAFASGKASIIAPLAGLYPLVSVPIAILFLGERIGPRESLGVAFALAAVVTLLIESKPETAPPPGVDAGANYHS